MTISEAKACQAAGMSASQVIAMLARERAERMRQDELVVLRAYHVLAEYVDQRAARCAYDYNGAR